MNSAAKIVLERDVPVPMRDGTILRADVWRPTDDGRYPVLLQRFPYDKSAALASVVYAGLEPARAVRQGFVVIIQDTRGRFASDGVFRAFQDEAADGADTVEWAARQSFSNGRVGMYGVSYGGATQLLAAAARPASLGAIVPHLTGAETYEGFLYQGGAFRLGFALWWAANSFARAELVRRRRRGQNTDHLAAELDVILRDPWSAFRHLPLNGLAAVNALMPSYRDWVDHPSRDGYWRAMAVSERYGSIACPALHIGGWNDIFLEGTLRNYAALGGRLLIGPWAHAVPFDVIGETEYGPDAMQASLDMTAVHLRWFDNQLSRPEEVLAPEEDAPVRIFVMGANEWRDEASWPLARAKPTMLFLRSGGRLAPAAADSDEQPDSYVFNPLDPVPTVGGATFLPGLYVGRHAGPRDQTAVELRPDVLTYTSEPLPRPTEISGRVAAVLFAASSAADTDWTAKLVDVHPDGRTLGLLDGIVRARYRNSRECPELLESGKVHEYELDLGSISIVIEAGHRLRLQISSSNFPKFDRNPNHGGDIPSATKSDYIAAHQSLFHDTTHRSRLILPIVR